MPRSSDRDVIIEEAKYPEDRAGSFDKDDRKQQSAPAGLVEQLQGKFESTDYGSTTGSPLERLEHMNKDINAIVAAREKIAKEKEAAEDAVWWEKEHAGAHDGGKGSEKDTRISGWRTGEKLDFEHSSDAVKERNARIPGDRMADSTMNKSKVVFQHGKEGDHSIGSDDAVTGNFPAYTSQDKGKSTSKNHTPIEEQINKGGYHGPIGNLGVDRSSSVSAASSSSSSASSSGSVTSKISSWVGSHLPGHKADSGSSLASSSTTSSGSSSLKDRDLSVSDRSLPEEHGVQRWGPTKLERGVQILGPGHVDLTAEKKSLDETKEARKRMWADFEPLRDDPDNHPSNDPTQRIIGVNDIVQTGTIRRQKQSSSSAFSPIIGAMENSDASRTHTRPGRDRAMIMGKDQAREKAGEFDAEIGSQAGGGGKDRSYQLPDQNMDSRGKIVDALDTRGVGSTSLGGSTGAGFGRNITIGRGGDSSVGVGSSRRSGKLASPIVGGGHHEVHDFLDSAGDLFGQHSAVSRPVAPDSDLAFDQGSLLERNLARTLDSQPTATVAGPSRVVLPTYLPPDSRAKDVSTSSGGLTGLLSSLGSKVHDLKETVSEKLESVKDKVEDKLESAKEAVEDKLEDAKETVEEGLDSAKEKIGEWKGEASTKIHSVQHSLADKTEDLAAKLRREKDELAADLNRTESTIAAKGREWKDDLSIEADRAKLKGRELKRDVEVRGREVRREAEVRGRDLGAEVRREAKEVKGEVDSGLHRLKGKTMAAVHDVEDEAKHLAAKVGNSWWNPLSHLKGEVKERPVEVEASPQGVHIHPIDAKASSSSSTVSPWDHRSSSDLASSKKSSSSVSAPSLDSVNPIHVPASLQGLEGGTPLPSPKTPHLSTPTVKLGTPAEPIYVPNSLRGLEGGTDLPPPKLPDVPATGSVVTRADGIYVPNSLKGLEGGDVPAPSLALPKVDLKLPSKVGIDEPVPVPNSLRGLESSNLPSGGVDAPSFKSDIGTDEKSVLRPKQRGGLLHNLMHMFDGPASRTSRFNDEIDRVNSLSSPQLRHDKLLASARDEWDLRSQDNPPIGGAPKVFDHQQPVSPAQSLARTLKDDSVASPIMSRSLSPVGGVGLRGRDLQSWDILHDRQFEELMAETLE